MLSECRRPLAKLSARRIVEQRPFPMYIGLRLRSNYSTVSYASALSGELTCHDYHHTPSCRFQWMSPVGNEQSMKPNTKKLLTSIWTASTVFSSPCWRRDSDEQCKKWPNRSRTRQRYRHRGSAGSVRANHIGNHLRNAPSGQTLRAVAY